VIYPFYHAGGLVPEWHQEGLFARATLRFQYEVVGLPDLSTDNYLEERNPLAPALSALMKPSRLGRVAQKYHAIRRIIESQQLDEVGLKDDGWTG